MKTITKIRNQFEWHGLCQGETLLEAALWDHRLIFVSDNRIKSWSPTILEMIFLLYENGHKNSFLKTRPNDIEFKFKIECLLHNKMNEIVWYANISRNFSGVLMAGNMMVANLANWHSYCGHYASYVLDHVNDNLHKRSCVKSYEAMRGASNIPERVVFVSRMELLWRKSYAAMKV